MEINRLIAVMLIGVFAMELVGFLFVGLTGGSFNSLKLNNISNSTQTAITNLQNGLNATIISSPTQTYIIPLWLAKGLASLINIVYKIGLFIANVISLIVVMISAVFTIGFGFLGLFNSLGIFGSLLIGGMALIYIFIGIYIVEWFLGFLRRN